MFSFSSKSIFSADGILGNPGIVNIFPDFATINSAPFFNVISLICIVKGSSQSKFLALSEKEYYVFAMHTGKCDNPNFSIFLISSSAFSEYSTFSAP